ncbi:MAG: hypothetical protein U0W40_10910 [Acidimicrobiia bacterium]
MQLIAEEKVTVFPGPPTVYQAMLNHPDYPNYDRRQSRSAILGAAAIPVPARSRLRRRRRRRAPGALDRRANQVAAPARCGRGIGHGDRVVVWSATSLDTLRCSRHSPGSARCCAHRGPSPRRRGGRHARHRKPALLLAGSPASTTPRIAAAAGITAICTAGLGVGEDDLAGPRTCAT